MAILYENGSKSRTRTITTMITITIARTTTITSMITPTKARTTTIKYDHEHDNTYYDYKYDDIDYYDQYSKKGAI